MIKNKVLHIKVIFKNIFEKCFLKTRFKSSLDQNHHLYFLQQVNTMHSLFWNSLFMMLKGIKPNSQLVINKKQRKHTPKKNNHVHKTVFTWFDNLPTSTKLQGYHYYQGKIQSTTCGYNIFSLYITQQQHHTKKP